VLEVVENRIIKQQTKRSETMLIVYMTVISLVWIFVKNQEIREESE